MLRLVFLLLQNKGPERCRSQHCGSEKERDRKKTMVNLCQFTIGRKRRRNDICNWFFSCHFSFSARLRAHCTKLLSHTWNMRANTNSSLCNRRSNNTNKREHEQTWEQRKINMNREKNRPFLPEINRCNSLFKNALTQKNAIKICSPYKYNAVHCKPFSNIEMLTSQHK